MNVEDCFLEAPLFGQAADKLEELAAEVERVRDGNHYAHLEQIAIKRAEKAEAALAEARQVVALFENYGCPVCHGDCASATPPVDSCPMQAASRVRKGGKVDG